MVFWALAVLLSPTPTTSHLVLGLAVLAAALLLALAIAAVATGLVPPAVPPAAPRTRGRALPRLLDPDAPGRPRPRAPSAYPTAA